MARSASAVAGEKPATDVSACRTSSAELRRQRGKLAAGFGDDVLDQQADQPADQFVHLAPGIEPRIGGADLADDAARQRHGGDVVEIEQFGAQPVVDVVGVVGDVVGEGGDLRLDARKAPQLQILQPRIVQDGLGDAVLAVGAERRCHRASVSGPLCLTRPSSVSQVRLRPSKAG